MNVFKLLVFSTLILNIMLSPISLAQGIENAHYNSPEVFSYNLKKNKFVNASDVSNYTLFNPVQSVTFPQETIYVLNSIAAKFDQVGISSILRKNEPGNHPRGLAIDIEFVVKNGVKYTHYSAFKGNTKSRFIFKDLAITIANTKCVYQILTAGSFATELRKINILSAGENLGSTNKLRIGTTPEGVDTNQRHEDHFHVDIAKRR
jgi:hypothetical protein